MENTKNKHTGKPDAKRPAQQDDVKNAEKQAEKDIQYDPDVSVQHKTDDLDEGELARLDNSNDKI